MYNTCVANTKWD